MEESANEEYENELIRKSQLKNFAIENSFPSLNRNFTKASIAASISNNALSERQNLKKRTKSQIETSNDSYQEVYVYRDVTRDVAEGVYYNLINSATDIYNKNIDFKKLGFDLAEVFKRSLKKKRDFSVGNTLKQKNRTPIEFSIGDTEYSDINLSNDVSVKGSKPSKGKNKQYETQFKSDKSALLTTIERHKNALQRKFNKSTIHQLSPMTLELKTSHTPVKLKIDGTTTPEIELKNISQVTGKNQSGKISIISKNKFDTSFKILDSLPSLDRKNYETLS